MSLKIILVGSILLIMANWAVAAAEQTSNCAPVHHLSCSFIAHEDVIGALAFSSDGTLLATASSDQTVALWDVSSGAKVRTLKGHRGEVWALAFSPDGRMLASGSYDFTIKLWDVVSGKELQTLTGHKEFVRSLDFSPDGSLLASGSWDHTIKLWKVSTGKLLRTLTGHGDWVVSVDFSPDGKRLVSGSDDFTVRIWSVENGALLHRMEGHSGNVWAVRFSPDGSTIASGSEDKTIRIWDANSGRVMHVLKGHEKEIRALEFSKDGNELVSGGRDGSVILWDPQQGQELRVIHQSATSDVWTVAFSPDGEHIASGACTKRNAHVCRRGEVRYDPIEDGEPVGVLDLAGFDANRNDRIEDNEFFKIVDAWIAKVIANEIFFEAVDLWISNQPITGIVAASSASTLGFASPVVNIALSSSTSAMRFSIKESDVSRSTLMIFDTNGHLIYSSVSQGNQLDWPLAGARQQRVANGVYLYSLTWQGADGSSMQTGIKKVFLLR